MLTEDECGRPYDHHGDWLPCHLHYNHGGDCHEANRQATLDSFRDRTIQAQHDGPWL